jgi:hypothetical protein
MKVIGVTGFARAGKDTFCAIAKDIFAKYNVVATQYSFAHVLKTEVAPFLRDNCDCDVWTQDTEIKKDMRDFLVWYGTTWWRKRDPKRWIRHVDVALKAEQPPVAIISDVRYPNEGEWVHSWGGTLVHVAAWKWQDGRDGYGDSVTFKAEFEAPNEQEKLNDPLMRAMSDVKILWHAKGLSPQEALENPDLRKEVWKALNSLDWFNDVLIQS